MRQRFADAGIAPDKVTCERETFTFDFVGPPTEFVEVFRDYYGPTMNAFAAAAANGKAADLERELIDLFERQNTNTEAGRTILPATFLRVTVEV